MKTRGEEISTWRGCGMPVTLVGPHGSSSFPTRCRTWPCPVCREILINEYIRKIKNAFMALPCVHVFVGYRQEKGKDLSNFIQHNVHGHYCRINGLDTSAIISDRKFDGAKRNDKKNFLENNLPDILNQSWEEGRRVSFSKGWIEPDKKKESDYWGIVLGNVRKDFYKLHSDEEKKAWLSKQQIFKLFTKGAEFLGQESPMKGKQL